MRITSLVGIGAGVCVLSWGCADATLDAENDPTGDRRTAGLGETLEHVVGGKPSAVCGFPMTAKIPGCTSTLLTPTILVTAKHCGPRAGMNVQFGEKTPYAFTVKAIKCVNAPDSDSSYCTLPDDERLKKVPIVPPLHGCEYNKFMKAGAKVMGVGWGQTRGTGPMGTKNEVEVPVVRVRDPYIDVGDMDSDLCFGDSGGGAYIHLVEGDKDWGWRLIGTVTGTARIPGGAPCGGTDYTTILRHIKMIEQNEQIDVTPCTDAAGNFAPGAACANFLTDIGTGGGTWPDCNPGPKTTVAIDSCVGAPPTPPGTGGAGGRPDGGAGGTGGRVDGGMGGTDGRVDGSNVDTGVKADASGTGGAVADGAAGGSSGGAAGMDASSTGSGGSISPVGTGGAAGGAGPDARPSLTPGPVGGCGCHVGAADSDRTGFARTGFAPFILIAFVLLRRRRRSQR